MSAEGLNLVNVYQWMQNVYDSQGIDWIHFKILSILITNKVGCGVSSDINIYWQVQWSNWASYHILKRYQVTWQRALRNYQKGLLLRYLFIQAIIHEKLSKLGRFFMGSGKRADLKSYKNSILDSCSRSPTLFWASLFNLLGK